ncbi:MAG: hypothetical protein NTY45_12165 [Elusimicrobia bacterium]|nr:hypothetical protein [Elusimicrobiota bacterium]
MKRIGLALIFASMAASAMAVELEQVSLGTSGEKDLSAGTVISGESARMQLNFQASGSAVETVVPEVTRSKEVTPKDSVASSRTAWKHVELTATDGTKILVDYSVQYGNGRTWAYPVWINVVNKSLGGNKDIQVTLLDLYKDYIQAGTVKDTLNINLICAGNDRYTGQAGWAVMLSSDNGINYRQEIAVKVITHLHSGEAREEWLTDPVNGSHNFKFELSRF